MVRASARGGVMGRWIDSCKWNGARCRSVVRASACGVMGRWIDSLKWNGARCRYVVRAFAHGVMDRSFMVDPLSYSSFQPVLHD